MFFCFLFLCGFFIIFGSINTQASPNIQLGTNPMFSDSFTGTGDSTVMKSISTSNGQDLIITDIYVGAIASSDCYFGGLVQLELTSGDIIGQFVYRHDIRGDSTSSSAGLNHRFATGLVVPNGETVSFTSINSYVRSSYCGSRKVVITVSGYHAKP